MKVCAIYLLIGLVVAFGQILLVPLSPGHDVIGVGVITLVSILAWPLVVLLWGLMGLILVLGHAAIWLSGIFA